MIKIAICSDLHWCKTSSIVRKRGKKYSARLENCIKTLNWFEKLAKDNNCTYEYFLGDNFDRASLDSEEISALNNVKWNKLEKYFLVGNHESNLMSLEYSTTDIFKGKFNVISKLTKSSINDKVDLYCIPYITTDKSLMLSDFVDNDNKVKIVFSHNDLSGVQYGRYKSSIGFGVENIKKSCALYFNGHLHSNFILDNIYNVGNITGQNFSEDAFNYQHNAYILTIDDDKLSVEVIENPYAFNFYKLHVNCLDDACKLVALKQNAIVSISCPDKFVADIVKLAEANKNIVEFRVLMSSQAEVSNDVFEFTEEDHLKQFIDFASSMLEQSNLVKDELAILGG